MPPARYSPSLPVKVEYKSGIFANFIHLEAILCSLVHLESEFDVN
ncbi:hypothetical protein RB2083_2655 [Rhodobacteraceae bacterium HTCC2083]|nr:hypothetical protein RB2083_2655 [Rhodobacteraceae bacterium HTCC2083]